MNTPSTTHLLPQDDATRKATPIMTGVLDYFPLAIAAIAAVSKKGNEQHNPGQALHWARGKSTDHANCLIRHLLQRGTTDIDGLLHSAKAAWRALALLQVEIERNNGLHFDDAAPPSPNGGDGEAMMAMSEWLGEYPKIVDGAPNPQARERLSGDEMFSRFMDELLTPSGGRK